MSSIDRSIIEIHSYSRQSNLLKEVSSIKLAVPTSVFSIPLAIEKVAAGFPSPAQDYVDKNLDMNEHLIKMSVQLLVRVASQSMLNAGIDIDDELVVDRSIEPKHNDIVIALVDNEFTVKRLMIDAEERWLKAENPEFCDIHLKEEQELLFGV